MVKEVPRRMWTREQPVQIESRGSSNRYIEGSFCSLSSASVQSFNFMTYWMLCSTKGRNQGKRKEIQETRTPTEEKGRSLSDDNEGTFLG